MSTVLQRGHRLCSALPRNCLSKRQPQPVSPPQLTRPGTLADQSPTGTCRRRCSSSGEEGARGERRRASHKQEAGSRQASIRRGPPSARLAYHSSQIRLPGPLLKVPRGHDWALLQDKVQQSQ